MSEKLFSKIRNRQECSINSKSAIFARFLACFVFIVLMPTILMGMAWYRDIVRKDYQEIMEKESRTLHDVTESFSQGRDSVEQDLLNMLYGTNFKNYVATGKPEYMTKVMTETFRVLSLNEILYSVYLYNEPSGTVWDSASKMQRLESFYDTGWLQQIEASVKSQTLSVRQNRDEGFGAESPYAQLLNHQS